METGSINDPRDVFLADNESKLVAKTIDILLRLEFKEKFKIEDILSSDTLTEDKVENPLFTESENDKSKKSKLSSKDLQSKVRVLAERGLGYLGTHLCSEEDCLEVGIGSCSLSDYLEL